ncbi:hypothetical protein O3G_MSEX007388 [Manduca sexta]|uniref:Uncharacterized protein n=1 Tax=Manduca sexta TaxID=7130 RepID=A0A921Z6A9_MANSE|nr:hypothetical protein O3G_MSEX007388 [Manduca sexta]
MSQPPPGRGRARPQGPSSPHNFRPPSPWAPSPPPLISGPRHPTAIVTPPPVHPSPKPFRPLHSPHNVRQHSPSPSSHFSISPYPMSPILGQSPEYFYSSPYEPIREYDYPGVPEPPPPPRPMIYEEDEEDRGPSTAEIIAQQSQEGYVDEKLAEYQATIQLLQGELVCKLVNT